MTVANNLTAVGAITASAALNATQGASLGAIATSGATCSPNGKIAASNDGSGAVLHCKVGIWQSLASSGGLPIGQLDDLTPDSLAGFPSYYVCYEAAGADKLYYIMHFSQYYDDHYFGELVTYTNLNGASVTFYRTGGYRSSSNVTYNANCAGYSIQQICASGRCSN